MPRTAIIPNSWLSLNSAKRMDARYWIHVSNALREAGHDPASATPEQVKEAINTTEQMITAAATKVKNKYAEAAALQAEARELSREVDALPTATRGQHG